MQEALKMLVFGDELMLQSSARNRLSGRPSATGKYAAGTAWSRQSSPLAWLSQSASATIGFAAEIRASNCLGRYAQGMSTGCCFLLQLAQMKGSTNSQLADRHERSLQDHGNEPATAPVPYG